MKRIRHHELIRLASTVLRCTGATHEVADEVAAHLVESDLRGHGSHGVRLLPIYLEHAQRGLLDVEAHATLGSQRGAISCFDGGAGFGRIVGREVMDAALARVAEHGFACTALRNAHHLGRIGAYAERCADAGYVSIHFVNVVGHDPLVAPWAGRERRLSTNPLCVAVPREGAAPFILDMATSAIAYGKVRAAHARGAAVPAGSLIDQAGHPSTDAAVMFERPMGAMRCFGGYKGFGLAMVCELLAGALATQWTIQPEHERPGTIINNMLSVLLDPEAFGPRASFEREVERLAGYVLSARAVPDSGPVRLPGDPEQDARADCLARGVPIDDVTWDFLHRADHRPGPHTEGPP